MIDILKLQSLPPQRIGKAAMATLTSLQSFQREEQIAAVGMAFVALLRKHGVDHASDVLEPVKNMLHDRTHNCREMYAVMAYVGMEL